MARLLDDKHFERRANAGVLFAKYNCNEVEVVRRFRSNPRNKLHFQKQIYALFVTELKVPDSLYFAIADRPQLQELKRVDAVWQKWLAHDPVALVASHQAALRQLRAIRFDCGTSDAMLGPNRKFAEALTAARIPHQFEEFDGDHTNRLRERLETRVLPFFSGMLLPK